MSARYPFAVIREKLFERGGRVADFAVGARSLPLPEQLEQWISDHAALATQAASPDDIAAYRDAAIAFLAEEYGIDTRGIAVLPAPGGRSAMSAFVACMLAPGDVVVVTEPGYPAFAKLAGQHGARVLSAPLQPDADFAPDFRLLDAELRQAVNALSINFPNNPTGAVLSDAVVTDIETLVSDSATLLNDAVYGPLCYAAPPRSLLDSGTALFRRTLELHALTKLYPLGPLSMSFLAGPEDLIEPIATYSEYAWSPASALQVGATTWCLRDRAGLIERRNFFAERIEVLRQTLARVGFRPYPTPAGIYVLCAVPPRLGGQAVDSAATAALRLMDEYDLAVVPWDLGTVGYLRFSALFRPQDLERLAALADVLDFGTGG